MAAKSQNFAFQVSKAPFEDIGKDRVRLHCKRRLGKQRFVILQLRHGERNVLVSALGHEADEGAIQMDIDLRSKLRLEIDQTADISISIAPWHQQLRWYLTATDPAVQIPACLGAWSLVMGVAAPPNPRTDGVPGWVRT